VVRDRPRRPIHRLCDSLEDVLADLDLTTNYSYPALCAYLVEQKVCCGVEHVAHRPVNDLLAVGEEFTAKDLDLHVVDFPVGQ